MASNTKRSDFFDSAGNKLPGIGDIIGKFTDPGGLLHWAWKLGAEGTSLQDGRKIRTLGHIAAERAIAIAACDPSVVINLDPDEVMATDKPIAVFREWAESAGLKILDHEALIASESLGYGGNVTTALISGETWVLSVKQGSALYREDILTAAAGAALWMREHPEQLIAGACFIRFGKEDGGFDVCVQLSMDDLKPSWQLFRTLQTAHKLLSDVNGTLKKGAA